MKKQKLHYTELKIAVIRLADEDVIRTSSKPENPSTVLIPDWN